MKIRVFLKVRVDAKRGKKALSIKILTEVHNLCTLKEMNQQIQS